MFSRNRYLRQQVFLMYFTGLTSLSQFIVHCVGEEGELDVEDCPKIIRSGVSGL